jgi:adenosylcobinamide-GDP ribazoletransferase
MDSFLLAIQFLTILPIRIKQASEQKIANSMVYFPIVGLFLGLFLWLINFFLGILNFSSIAINIILAVFLITITGGLHLDGLCDTADAFLSRKPKEEMLKIMRDPHVGVMGVLSLMCIILLKIGLLCSISAPVKTQALLLMCILSRWSAVLMMFLFPYARQEGKAKTFISLMNKKIFILSTILAFSLAFLVGQINGLIISSIIAVFVYLFGKFVSKKINGITGDTLGATIELSEVITLFAVCLV